MKKSRTMGLSDRKMYWAVYMTKKYKGAVTFEDFCRQNPQLIGLDGYRYKNRRNKDQYFKRKQWM